MAKKRQSEFSVRSSDYLDTFLSAENPDPAGDGSVPQRSTARLRAADFSSYLDQVVTANTTLYPGQIMPVDASGGAVTITAPDNALESMTFGVMMMAAGSVTVSGNGFDMQVPYSTGYAPTVELLQNGGVYGWTLADPDLTGLRWMISGVYNDTPPQPAWSQATVTPANSPYQIKPYERVRYDARTATSETSITLITPPAAFPGETSFAMKEVYGTNQLITLQTNETTLVENPMIIPASAATSIVIGGAGQYIEWSLSDNRAIWLVNNLFRREQSQATVVFTGTSTNGDVPAGNITANFSVLKVTRTALGFYDVYLARPLVVGTVLKVEASVFSTNLPALTIGSGAHTGTTFGAAGTAKVSVEMGYRSKTGNWTDSDFTTSPDQIIVEIQGLA